MMTYDDRHHKFTGKKVVTRKNAKEIENIK